jgi:dUTP pyrophosphatase
MSSKLLKIKFKKKDEKSKLPFKGSLHAACYDVYVHSISAQPPNKIMVGLGFSTEIPVGYKGIIVPRSSLSNINFVLSNSMGVIDADYRGEWMVSFKCLSSLLEEAIPFEVGDRCAQIYFEKIQEWEIEEVDVLSDTIRGEGGFGSTGKS